MSKKRRQRLCRICKKRPVWIGGDVKNPGPVCKRCYHERVWPERLKRRGQKAQGPDTSEPKVMVVQTALCSNLRPSGSKRWKGARKRYGLSLEEVSMAKATRFEPWLMHGVATGQSVKRGTKLPAEVSAEERWKVKREIRERYRAAVEKSKEVLLSVKLSLTLPAELMARIQSECQSKGLRLGDEIRALLETRFSSKTGLAEARLSEPAGPQAEQSPQLRPRRRFVLRTDEGSAA